MTAYVDEVFAPIDLDHQLERIAGGNETEVYCTDDRRYVVKLKHDLGGDTARAIAYARQMRAAAASFCECLGPSHTVASHYVVARDKDGRVQVLVLQPFIAHARPLFEVDYAALNDTERSHIAAQLRDIVRRSLTFFRATRTMPDLYGRSSTSHEDRQRLNAPHMLPARLWSFIVKRNLLRSRNLLLTDGPEHRVVLVDYDLMRRGRLYRSLYYTVRWMLFWRDHALILLMRQGRSIPPGA